LPIVVVTKTEGYATTAPEKLNQYRTSAAQVFNLPENVANSLIVFTGTGNDYVAKWRPEFANAISELRPISGDFRTRQLTQLRNLLQVDLVDILNKISEADRIKAAKDNLQEGPVTIFLEKYDQARNRLRDDYLKKLDKALSLYASDAAEKAVNSWIKEEEGFSNGVRNALRWLKTSSGEREKILPGYISKAWKGENGFYPYHLDLLAEITSAKLGALSRPGSATEGSKPARLLGYKDEKGKTVTWTEPSEETQQNLMVLFNDYRDAAPKPNKDLERSVKLLPTLALEFARIGAIFPTMAGVSAADLSRVSSWDWRESAKRIESDFEFLRGTHSNIIKGIALMLAVDVAADGKIDTIPALLSALSGGTSAAGTATIGTAAAGTAATSGLSTVTAAVTGFIAVGFLLFAVTREIQRADADARDMARRIIYAVRDRHYEHYRSSFEQLMDGIRERIEERLIIRYRLDEALMRRDRLTKAMADVRSLNYDMLEALGELTPGYMG
jgi:hypothetical protein